MVSFLRSLPAKAATQPEQLFWWLVGLHLVVWTLLSTLSSPNAPLDVIEGYGWGREWLIGTYKHPPMQAWCLEIAARLTGRAPWAHFLLSQMAVVTAFWAVWQTGRRMMSETQALIGVLLLEGVIYYNFTSAEFNPNVLQLAFWALAGWSFHRAVRENRLLDWILLGVWGAAGLYTKYSSALLLGVFAVLVIARPEARRCLKKPGPYLAALIVILLFLPHMLWLIHHDFLPFTYLKDRLNEVKPATRYMTPPAFFPTFLLSPVVFIVAQLLAVGPTLLLFLTLDDPVAAAPGERMPNKFDRAFLVAASFVPMLLTLLMAIFFGFRIHDMWGAPFFNFAGLWAVAKFYPNGAHVKMRFAMAWLLVFSAGLLVPAGVNLLSPYVNQKGLRVNFPGTAMATIISDTWHQHYGTSLSYAIGDTWPAGNLAYYAPGRPHIFTNADPVISPWIDENDVQKRGGVVVWCHLHCSRGGDGQMLNQDIPPYLHDRFPMAEIQKPLVLKRQTEADVPEVVIGWALVPPR